jgi:hypothetical protein
MNRMNLKKAKELRGLIRTLESAAKDLMDRAEGIQAVERNGERLLASLRMLRINISDLVAEEDGG